MSDTERPDDFYQVINEKFFTITEAQQFCKDKMNIGSKNFYKHIRPRLYPGPQLVTRDEKGDADADSIKVAQSEVEQVVYDIKKSFLERNKYRSNTNRGLLWVLKKEIRK